MYKLLVMLFVAVNLFAQVEFDEKIFPYTFEPVFSFENISYKSEEPGKTRLDIFIQIPYTNLRFLKEDNKFTASYMLTITIYDSLKSNIINSNSWDETVNVTGYNAAHSRQNFNLNLKSFNLYPGRYRVICEVFDKDSKRNYALDKLIDVKSINDNPDLSEILLIAGTVMHNNVEKLIPNISREIFTSNKELPFVFEIYSDKKCSIYLEYMITDQSKTVYFQKRFLTEIDSGKNIINQTFENTTFSLGVYELRLSIMDENFNVLKTSSKQFYSFIKGYPRSIVDLDISVDQMVYIASADELDRIKSMQTYETKLNAFTDFWSKKDPSPGTSENEALIEYYRRIAHANKNFSKNNKGWRTDMGMVYIILGAPNSVERRPFEQTQPYEIWHYFDINQYFIFVDYTGFGDYRLKYPLTYEWAKYRP